MFWVVRFLCSRYKYCGNDGRTSYGLFAPGFMSCELLVLSSFMSINKCIVLYSKSCKANGTSELKPFKTQTFYAKSQNNKTNPKLTFKKLLLWSNKVPKYYIICILKISSLTSSSLSIIPQAFLTMPLKCISHRCFFFFQRPAAPQIPPLP